MRSLGLYGKRQEMDVKIRALSAWIIRTKLVFRTGNYSLQTAFEVL